MSNETKLIDKTEQDKVRADYFGEAQASFLGQVIEKLKDQYVVSYATKTAIHYPPYGRIVARGALIISNNDHHLTFTSLDEEHIYVWFSHINMYVNTLNDYLDKNRNVATVVAMIDTIFS